MAEKPLSMSQPRSRWDKMDSCILFASLMGVGAGFMFLERFNEPRRNVRSVLMEHRNTPSENPQEDIAPIDSNH